MYKVTLVIILTLLLYGCNRSSLSQDSIYTGTFTKYKYNSYNEEIDTFSLNIRMKFSEDRFAFLDELGEELCNGTYSRRFGNISFESTECSCWCDCDPNIDCAGHPILNEYRISFNRNGRLDFQNRWRYETTSGSEIIIDSFYELEEE